MDESSKRPSPSTLLPDEHPAKPVEEILRTMAPQLAAGFYALFHRPARPPLLTRVTLRAANRLVRSGRALHAFAIAYSDEPFPFFASSSPFFVPDVVMGGGDAAKAATPPASPPRPAPAPHINGIANARPPAAGGKAS